jgi:DNA-binding NtrC family response regulator
MAETSVRILIVEDEENIREVLRRGLSRAGYESVTAGGADQASELLEAKDLALVLLDITMPGKSGMMLLPEIVVQHPDVAVVMLTGVADVSIGVQAMRQGASDYINKPISLPDLIVRVEQALTKRALQMENRAYRRKLEELVEELGARQEQRKRELDALNRMFQTHLGQAESSREAYDRLKRSLASFSSELEELAAMVGVLPSS